MAPVFLSNTLARMERTSTYLALGLVLLSWGLFLAGWITPIEPRQLIRQLGFIDGGLISVPTVLLCAYYIRIRGVRTSGVKAATLLSGSYVALFAVFLIALLAGSPLAHMWF